MNTEQLIDSLSRNVSAVSRHAIGRRLACGLCAGAVITTFLVIWLLGLRPDFSAALHSSPFWMKWAYTLSIGVIAIIAVARLARPTPISLRGLWLLALPVLLLLGIGLGELANTSSQEWLAMWLGRSSSKCPWLVLGLAMPMLFGLFWSFRGFAPRQERTAGAAAGLASGAWAAAIYCLHCPESTALFVVTWYTLGMILAALIGALLGPRLMRW